MFEKIILLIFSIALSGVIYLSGQTSPTEKISKIEFPPVVIDKNTKTIALNISSFGYYLKNPIIDPIKASLFDLMIMNYETRSNNQNVKFTKEQIATVKSNKKAIAYVSIGEAESYRDYWIKGNWSRNKPAYVGQENLYWRGNFLIKDLKNEDWKKIVFDQVDGVIDQGFDGILLGGLNYSDAATHDLISLVSEISKHAKAKNPKFIVMVQDAEELLANDSYLNVIDGIVKQNLLYSWQANGITGPKNSEEAIKKSTDLLNTAKISKKSVLVVEYVQGQAWNDAKEYFSKYSFIGYSAPKQLNALRLGQ